MDIKQYFNPENPVAGWIISVLMILLLVWLVWLVCWGVWLIWQRLRMKRCADVGTLVDALHSLSVVPGSTGDGEETSPSSDKVSAAEPVAKEGDEAARALAFGRFCDEKSLPPKSLVARHIKAIFDAGCTQSRLEIGELIKHTTNSLFRGNSLLRSLLATFIVFGLLGTLFGLADSLAELSPLAPGMSQQVNEDFSLGLSRLLGQLKSAFAPSICGIAFTILGLILLTFYIQFVCNPVRNMLERLTLTTWVPQLFPNTTQRIQSALSVTEEQIRQNLKDIQKVAVFSHDIQNRMDTLNQSFELASQSLNLLERSTSQINTFANRFANGVGGLTAFQEDLRALYRQVADESKAFHENLRGSVERSEEFHQETREILAGQNQQLQTLLKALKLYEGAYIDQRADLDRRLGEVLDAATAAFESIGERNEQVVAALGEPLRKDLGDKLGAIENAQNVQLRGIQNTIGRFDAPINKAADQIERTMEAVVKRTETLTRELQGEIVKQDAKNREQLKHLGELNTQIAALLQNTQLPTVSRGITDLSQSVVTLGKNLLSLGQSFTLAAQNDQQFNHLSAQNQEVVKTLKSLSNSLSDFQKQIVGLEHPAAPPALGSFGAVEYGGYGRARREGGAERPPDLEGERLRDGTLPFTLGGGEVGDGQSSPHQQTRRPATRTIYNRGADDDATTSDEQPSLIRRILTRLRHSFRWS